MKMRSLFVFICLILVVSFGQSFSASAAEMGAEETGTEEMGAEKMGTEEMGTEEMGAEEMGVKEAGFTVARLVTAENVADREPVNATNTFPATTETVYCFLEARNIKEDTEVSMVWYYNDEEAALVTLLLRTSNRWRTWSSKQIAGRTGKWKVVLKDSSGNELKTVEFTVETESMETEPMETEPMESESMESESMESESMESESMESESMESESMESESMESESME